MATADDERVEQAVTALLETARLLAAQSACARRTSYPLKLWPDDPDEPPPDGWFQVIDGEMHYLPRPENRARFARNFLQTQATFPHAAEIPSVAQLRNLPKIVALARDLPTDQAAREVENALGNMLTCEPPFQPYDDSIHCPFLDWYSLLKGSDSVE